MDGPEHHSGSTASGRPPLRSGIFEPGVWCRNVGWAYLKSLSSSSFTSAVKDFIAPIPVEVPSCEPKLLVNWAHAEVTNHGKVSDSGKVNVTENGIASLFGVPDGGLLAGASADELRTPAGATPGAGARTQLGLQTEYRAGSAAARLAATQVSQKSTCLHSYPRLLGAAV